MSNSTFTSNLAVGGISAGGAIFFYGSVGGNISDSSFTNNSALKGGAIEVQGNNLNITNSTFTGNSATGNGGGAIYDNYSVTITNSTLTGNSAAFGGAIANYGLSLDVINSTFSDNVAWSGSGGAIYSYADVIISSSTFSGNVASSGDGGALYNQRSLGTLSNCTFAGNSAPNGKGGAVYNSSRLLMRNCTLSGNAASSGGGLYDAGSFQTNAFNMIIANSTSGGDCVDAFSPLVFTHSLLGNNCGTASSTNIISQNPLLGPLADNGGPTKTFALLPGSPAINAGAVSNVNVPINLTTDQRGTGFDRNSGGGVDMGAFEVQSLSCPAGQYNNGTSCVDAAPGHHVPNAGATEQIPCAEGRYQPNSGAISCIAASPGNYVDTQGATAQTQCAVGTYQANTGASSCILADAGYFVGATEAIAQTQ